MPPSASAGHGQRGEGYEFARCRPCWSPWLSPAGRFRSKEGGPNTGKQEHAATAGSCGSPSLTAPRLAAAPGASCIHAEMMGRGGRVLKHVRYTAAAAAHPQSLCLAHRILVICCRRRTSCCARMRAPVVLPCMCHDMRCISMSAIATAAGTDYHPSPHLLGRLLDLSDQLGLLPLQRCNLPAHAAARGTQSAIVVLAKQLAE